jgi:hypothetical protein
MYTELWWGNLKEGDRFEDSFLWDDSVKMDLKGIGWEGTDWFLLAQDRNKCVAVVNTAINRRAL